jgi:hypothetical protein
MNSERVHKSNKCEYSANMNDYPNARRVTLRDLRMSVGTIARQAARGRQPIIITDHGDDLVMMAALDYDPGSGAAARSGDLDVTFHCKCCGSTTGMVATAPTADDKAEQCFTEQIPVHLADGHRRPRLGEDEQPIPFPGVAA